MASIERVLLIEPQGEPGGMWHYAGCLADALSGAGLDITLATISPYEPVTTEHSIRVCSIGTRADQGSPLPMRLVARAVNVVDRRRRLRQLVRALRPGIVHLNNPLSKFDFLAFRRLRSLGPRFVYTAHDPKPDTGTTWFDWARFRAADAILVHSTNAEADLAAGGIPKSKLARIHHGNYLKFCENADLSNDEAKRRLGLPSSARVLLFFGTILPYKGLDILLKAFSLMSRQRSDLYLVIAGEPLEDFTPYRRDIERFDLGRRTILDLRYIPFDEFRKYFRSADVVVFPYRNIYQSGVLQLAYGFGRPVASTNVGGLGELIAEDRTGVVAPAADPRLLADAILHLLSDPATAEAMGQRGRHLADTKYAWPTIAQQVIEVYRTVTARPADGELQTTRALVR